MIRSSAIFSSSIPKPQIGIGYRNGVASSSTRRALLVRCSGVGDGEKSTNLKDALSGLVGEQVDELLNREENKGLLEGLQRASDRVESAKRQLAEIQRQELEAKLLQEYVNRLEARAFEVCSFALILANSISGYHCSFFRVHVDSVIGKRTEEKNTPFSSFPRKCAFWLLGSDVSKLTTHTLKEQKRKTSNERLALNLYLMINDTVWKQLN